MYQTDGYTTAITAIKISFTRYGQTEQTVKKLATITAVTFMLQAIGYII